MDAVDTALVEIGHAAPSLIATAHTPWPSGLRKRLVSLATGAQIDATALAVLDTEVGEHFAAAISRMLQEAEIDPGRIDAIGCHGQTVAHSPDTRPATTLQLGDANVIAERTHITTINDFRRRDMAAGGQGAPLVPAFHEALLRTGSEDRIVLNLGGIANITVLPAEPARPTFGFDTGPANCLMDSWAQQQLGREYDEDGSWAASEQPDPVLLAHLLEDPYFDRSPPKSTGTQHFSGRWLNTKLAAAKTLSPARVQATLLALTCKTVADAVHCHAPDTGRILVCGGGAHNSAVLEQLADISGLPVETTAGFGIDPDWMETMAFAWLAQRTLAGEPGNLPAVTGAAGPRILGAIHPA